jgi:hypothetical protein
MRTSLLEARTLVLVALSSFFLGAVAAITFFTRLAESMGF